MTRKLRELGQGMTHHCYSRCHGKRNFLLGHYGKKYFIESVQMCQEKYDFELVAAEIVANHIHLIIRTIENKDTISRIMQFIKARIAEKYNKANEKTGAFWNERFGSTIIEESENPQQYLLWLLWYIGYNPVRKRICYDPRKTEIGFINCYLDKNHQTSIKIVLHSYFYNLGNSFEECAEKFLVYEDVYRKRLTVYF